MKRIKKVLLFGIVVGMAFVFVGRQKNLSADEKENFSIYDFSQVTKGLPSSWGKIVRSGDVVPATERAYTASLTFEDEKGTIRLVYVRFELEAIEVPEVHYVPKKITYQVFVLPRDKSK